MRSVIGLFGRTVADAGPDDKKPLSRLIPHLNDALKKPATDDRLIFIDLNAPQILTLDGEPDWLVPAMRRLEKFERKEHTTGAKAYVFVTNMAFHRQLASKATFAAAPFGLGFPDFNKPGKIRLSDAYRQKRKHADAHTILNAIQSHLRFPTTFDGKLPSESFGRPTSRVDIGGTYFFEDAGAEGTIGTVTSAFVNEEKKESMIAISTKDDQAHILRSPMSDADFAEYVEFRDSYFGQVVPGPKEAKDDFEFFEWLMNANENLPRTKMLEWFSAASDLAELEKLSDDDLRITYCEAVVAAIKAQSSGG